MYNVRFYKNQHGIEPVIELLQELKQKSKTDKNCRIRLDKINDYIQILAEHGTAIGMPYVEKIDRENNIWELRPNRDRIFFVAWVNNTFILLHTFLKKTQKTPKREIEKARRELKDLIERGLEDE